MDSPLKGDGEVRGFPLRKNKLLFLILVFNRFLEIFAYKYDSFCQKIVEEKNCQNPFFGYFKTKKNTQKTILLATKQKGVGAKRSL